MRKYGLLFCNIIVTLIIFFSLNLLLINLKLFLPKYVLKINESNFLYEQLEHTLKKFNKEINNITKIIMYQQFPNGQKIRIYYMGSDNTSKEVSFDISSHEDIYYFIINHAEEWKLDSYIVYVILIIDIVLIIIVLTLDFIVLINKKKRK